MFPIRNAPNSQFNFLKFQPFSGSFPFFSLSLIIYQALPFICAFNWICLSPLLSSFSPGGMQVQIDSIEKSPKLFQTIQWNKKHWSTFVRVWKGWEQCQAARPFQKLKLNEIKVRLTAMCTKIWDEKVKQFNNKQSSKMKMPMEGSWPKVYSEFDCEWE